MRTNPSAKEQSMRNKVAGIAMAIASIVVFIIVFQLSNEVSSPSGPIVQSMVQDGADQVARDAVTQYGIAARSGTATDRCVQAMSVTAAYLQAKDESHYKSWKAVERSDCAAAGVPQ
jgi:hypothetical protein